MSGKECGMNKHTCDMSVADAYADIKELEDTGVLTFRRYLQRKCWKCGRVVDVFAKYVRERLETDDGYHVEWEYYCTQCYGVMKTGSYISMDLNLDIMIKDKIF